MLLKQGKNGKIELMRFVFCLAVLFRHINHDVWEASKAWGRITFFKYGFMGVEFFFLVSGYLMAASIAKRAEREAGGTPGRTQDLGVETVRFLGHKLSGILPYHIVCCALMIVVCLARYRAGYVKTLIDALPSLLFLQRIGIGGGQVLNVEWYIGSMLLAMLVIYPLCRRYYSVFSRLAAPAAGLLITGYLVYKTGCVAGSGVWLGWTYKCNLRAIAEICLGICCFEVCRLIRGRQYTFVQRLLFSLTEAVCYLMPLVFMCSSVDRKYEGYVVMMLAAAVTISFSGAGVLGERGVFQNRACMFLGAVSLPVYLVQNITRKITVSWLDFLAPEAQAVLITVSTVLCGILLYLAVGRWSASRRRAASGIAEQNGTGRKR